MPKTARLFRPERQKGLRRFGVPTHTRLFQTLLQHRFVSAFDSAVPNEITLFDVCGIIDVVDVVAYISQQAVVRIVRRRSAAPPASLMLKIVAYIFSKQGTYRFDKLLVVRRARYPAQFFQNAVECGNMSLVVLNDFRL
jgi:hypothetical protein